MRRLVPKIERTGDRQIDRAQENANETTRRLAMSPAGAGAYATVDDAGRLKTDIVFIAGGTARLRHGLQLPVGGTPRGWIVTDVSGGYSSFRRTAWDDKTISIQAENACTARFWVFA